MEITTKHIAHAHFDRSPPFDHLVIDDFVCAELGHTLCNDFPDYNHSSWFAYHSVLEKKKTIREWGQFPPVTYQFFMHLCSEQFVDQLRVLTGVDDLVPDMGLHGAGWHISQQGSHLNVHQDYAIHPFANLQRKYNLIVYLTPQWDPAWGGGLELWSHDDEHNQPLEKVVSVENRFCRAVLFDTTQNSWHGYPDAIQCPDHVYRKSIAMYYLSQPSKQSAQHQRALYAPSESQKQDPEVAKLIQQRVQR